MVEDGISGKLAQVQVEHEYQISSLRQKHCTFMA